MADTALIDRNKTAVIIIDFQVGSLGFFPKEIEDGLISRANQYQPRARQKGIPVIFSDSKSRKDPDTELHPQLVVQSGELVLA